MMFSKPPQRDTVGLQQTCHVCLVFYRLYDTTLDYFINVSTSCSSTSRRAAVRLEVGLFASLCQYFSESEKQWRTDGMVPLAETNASRAVCRTRHLTAFAAGLFVPTNAISFKLPVGIRQVNTHFFVFMRRMNPHLILRSSLSGAFRCTEFGRAPGVCVGLAKLRRCCCHLAQVGPAGFTPGWCGSTLWPGRTFQVRGSGQDWLDSRGR